MTIQSKISKGKRGWSEVRRKNQARTSKGPFPRSSHRTHSTPQQRTVTTCAKCCLPGKRAEPERPGLLSGLAHVDGLCLPHGGKFRAPWNKSGVQEKPYCAPSSNTGSHTCQLGSGGNSPKVQVPTRQPRADLETSLSKDSSLGPVC